MTRRETETENKKTNTKKIESYKYKNNNKRLDVLLPISHYNYINY